MKGKSCKGCKFLRKHKDEGWFCSNSVKAYEGGVIISGDSPGLFMIKDLKDIECSVYEKK
jgi:hypothetical protein